MGKLESVCGVEFLREAFRYDPSTGKLYWRESRPLSHFKSVTSQKIWTAVTAGKEAGCDAKIRQTTYRIVKVNGIRTTSHQIIFAMEYGFFAEIVDHIDGNGLNNKLDNLRQSCLKSNPKNAKVYSSNTSGLNGVNWVESIQRWQVYCNLIIDGVVVKSSTKRYKNIFDAACYRISWMNQNGYTRR